MRASQPITRASGRASKSCLTGGRRFSGPSTVCSTPAAPSWLPGCRGGRSRSVFRKGTDPRIDSYSGFFDNGHLRSTGLAEYLRMRGVRHVFVLGLATDYCVMATALDAAGLGPVTYLVEDVCRGVNLQPGDVRRAINDMCARGVRVIRSAKLLRLPR